MKRQKHLLPAVDSKRWRNGCFAACRKSLGNAFLGVDGNGAGRNERNAAMNKIVITAAVAALVFATFAQGIPQPKAVREADAPAGVRSEDGFAVKGGAFDSKRTDCRTEARTESRKTDAGYPNVTFRVIREDK